MDVLLSWQIHLMHLVTFRYVSEIKISKDSQTKGLLFPILRFLFWLNFGTWNLNFKISVLKSIVLNLKRRVCSFCLCVSNCSYLKVLFDMVMRFFRLSKKSQRIRSIHFHHHPSPTSHVTQRRSDVCLILSQLEGG